MRKLSFVHSVMAALLLGATLTACSDSTDEPANAPEEQTASNPHYDLTVCVEKHGGMNRDKVHYTMSLASLSDPNTVIDFNGKGVEITDYTMECIYDNKYMYQVPVSNDRFSKLQLKDGKMNVIQEQPFKINTYKARNYAHAWLADHTLLIVSTDGEHKEVIWTKLNADDMRIIGEGTLDISVDPDYNVLTTSGAVAYRKSDNKLFYFYYNKQETSGSNKTSNEPMFRVAVIDANTMAVEKNFINKEANQMQASAYGELLQQTLFFDENDNLYVAAFSSVNKKNFGRLLRIKKGEFDFEAGYNAFPEALGKLLTVQYMGNGKVLAYSGDNALGTSIDSYAYYYSVIDINSQTSQRLQYNGAELPISGGSFSQRSCAVDGKGYFAIDAENSQPQIYVYDVATGSVSAGAKLAEGFYFEQIHYFSE